MFSKIVALMILSMSALVANQMWKRQSLDPSAIRLVDFGAIGDGQSHPLSSAQLRKMGLSFQYSPGTERNTVALLEAARQAKGKTILVDEGTYVFSGTLASVSEVSFGQEFRLKGNAIFRTKTPNESPLLFMTLSGSGRSPASASLEGVRLENIWIQSALSAHREASTR